MWLVVVAALVLVIIIALICEALGYDIKTRPSSSMREYLRERDKLVTRWFSGDHQPDDEERMFEEFYEGDIDDSMWN